MGLLVEFRNINKRFPGVQALRNVSFGVEDGDVHALVGENGAGKTTFINICGGIEKRDSGQIIWKGQEVAIRTSEEAKNAGIGIVHQNFPQCQNLTIAQNIYMPQLSRTSMKRVNWKKYERKSDEVLRIFDSNLHGNSLLKTLTIAQRQIVEICKVFVMNVDLFIMDEPTSALSMKELEAFFEVVGILKSSKKTIIYVSHKLDEIFRIADKVTVLKDGEKVSTTTTKTTNPDEVSKLMIGHELARTPAKIGRGPRISGKTSVPLLKIEKLAKKDDLYDLDFEVYGGEIVGLAGLQGSGCSLLMKVIYGLESHDAGRIMVDGKELHSGNPRESIMSKVAYVPIDRHREGLIRVMSVAENVCLSSYGDMSSFGWISKRTIGNLASQYIVSLDIKMPDMWGKVEKLSGGNQQKVLVARCLAKEPRLLLLDDPTRGVDVGAKEEIHNILRSVVGKGCACILTSSELPELVDICDRVITMYRGRVVGILSGEYISQEEVMRQVTGATKTDSEGRTHG